MDDTMGNLPRSECPCPPSDTIKPQVRAYAGPPKRGHFYRSSTGRSGETLTDVGHARSSGAPRSREPLLLVTFPAA